jgi:hypothetical protein
VLRFLVAFLVFLAGIHAQAVACSVTDTYVRPTNFELVQMADAIVVARAVDEADASSVRFRVATILKGEAPEFVSLSWARLGRSIPSDRNSIDMSNEEGHMGPCNRTTFARGGEYVLFLQRNGDELFQIGIPFSRINEDYDGPNGLWTRVIRAYVDIQSQYPPMLQLDVLERRLQDTLAERQSRDRDERARDIADHLMSRSPWKPTQYLVETYETLDRGETPRFSLRSLDADQEQSEAQALTQLLFGQSSPEAATPADQQDFVLRSLVIGDHPDAAPLFERLLAAPELSPRRLGLALQFLAKNGQYERAYALIESRVVPLLDATTDEGARALIRSIQRVQLGDAWEPGQEHWRAYPDIAERWPALARRLWLYQVDRFGERAAYPFPDVDIR